VRKTQLGRWETGMNDEKDPKIVLGAWAWEKKMD
jgi:hypothetical protein